MLYKTITQKKSVVALLFSTLLLLSLFLLVETIKITKEIRFIGSGIPATNTIVVQGEGKVSVVPNIAILSFTVEDTQNTVAQAQTNTATISNRAVNYLKKQGVAEKDIQTASYNTFPKYRYEQQSGKQILEGYRASQTITVKVRNLESVGKILVGLGEIGAQNINGPSFEVDNPQKVQSEARDKAIADAKQKAQALAKSLGIRLVRVVSFSENNGGMPIFARAFDVATPEGKVIPDIPVGQNDITSRVTITYEIQ